MKRFMECNQNQLTMLPPNLDEIIDEKHLVRVIDYLINQISPKSIEDHFPGGGTPSYHPRMMLKIIIYAYCSKIYSCRRIAKAIRQDVTFMWLAGSSRPNFNTINRFRSDYLQKVLPKVFTEILDILHENRYIRYEDYFVDGTKLEANAGKYSHVWKKNTIRYKAAVKRRIDELFKEIDDLNEEEDKEYGDNDLPERGEQSEITSKIIEDAAKRINDRLEKEPDQKTARRLKSQKKRLEKEREKLEKYNKQERLFGTRNSYSRTDTDATFMRLKDDTLRPAYNVQLSTENQFIVHYTAAQKASDLSCFKEHVEKLAARGERYLPSTYTGDSGYGSEENYACLKKYNIDSYLKYNTFHYEQKAKFRQNIYHRDNMLYDKKRDCFICPTGKTLSYQETRKQQTANGYPITIKYYECEDCSGCMQKELCTKATKNRRVQVRPELEVYKAEMRVKLFSPKGQKLRRRRGYDVETAFGDMKKNQNFSRFQLRGLKKVEHELGLISLAYNLRKIHALNN